MFIAEQTGKDLKELVFQKDVLFSSSAPGGQEQPCFSDAPLARTESFLESYRSAEEPEPLASPADGFSSFPERRLHEAELVVKDETEEEESAESSAPPLGSVHAFVTAEAPPWAPAGLYGDAADPSVSFCGRQTEPIPSVFAPHASLRLDNMARRIHPEGRPPSVLMSAAKMKRRANRFGYKKPQAGEGHGVLSQINAVESHLVAQQAQHQRRDPPAPHEGVASASPALCWQSRGGGGFGLARRARAPWRCGLGEKRFGCSYCDKSFLRFSQLKEHLRSHTGEKPFSCVQCGRCFTKQCNLTRHAVVHSGEKPFECSLCGKCFTQRSSLKSHQKTAH